MLTRRDSSLSLWKGSSRLLCKANVKKAAEFNTIWKKRSLHDFLTPSDKTSVSCSEPLSMWPYNNESLYFCWEKIWDHNMGNQWMTKFHCALLSRLKSTSRAMNGSIVFLTGAVLNVSTVQRKTWSLQITYQISIIIFSHTRTNIIARVHNAQNTKRSQEGEKKVNVQVVLAK